MRFVALALSLSLLGGCAVFSEPGEIPVSEKLSSQAKAAQTAINEANVLLAAAARVIKQNAADGIMTKAEAQKALDQVRSYAADVDKAKNLLAAGEVLNAQNKAELVHKLIVALHREVSERARNPQ